MRFRALLSLEDILWILCYEIMKDKSEKRVQDGYEPKLAGTAHDDYIDSPPLEKGIDIYFGFRVFQI